MRKLAMGIIFYSLSILHAEAQQLKDITLSRDKIEKAVIKILKDSLDEPCRKTIVSLQGKLKYLSYDSLLKPNSSELNEKAARRFINYGNRFISIDSKKCDSTVISFLRKSTESIVSELERELKVLKASNDAKVSVKTSSLPPVRLKIIVISNHPESSLSSQIRLYKIDSTITNVGSETDSTGYGNFSLVPGKYSVRIEAPHHEPLDSEFTVVNEPQDLVFRLKIRSGDKTSELATPAVPDSLLPGFFKGRIIWTTLIVFLFIVMALSAILHLTAYVKTLFFANQFYTRVEPGNTTFKNDDMLKTINSDIAILKSSLLPVKEESEVVPVGKDQMATGGVSNNRYFLSEIMMTAGPRKKPMNEPNADKDLGEDVCGLIANCNEVLLWLLDGTSDLHTMKNPADQREYFSSRLLAQCLANEIRKSFTEKAYGLLEEVIDQSIEKVKTDWLMAINQLPNDEQLLIRNNIVNKNFPECASTLLLGHLSINGDFTAYRSGDSKMILFNHSPQEEIRLIHSSLSTKNEECNDRIFFRICFDKNDALTIQVNQPKYEIVRSENVGTMISFSDGIGVVTEELLKNEFTKQPNQVREEIMHHLQGTQDDKSICFITIKENK